MGERLVRLTPHSLTGSLQWDVVMAPESEQLSRLVAARFEQSMAVPEAFFAAEAGRIAEACWAMARQIGRAHV
jgi:hypothetical protein